jgi:polyhydroxyalkanoate synthase
MRDAQTSDPGAAAEQLAALAERSQRLVQAFWQRKAEADGGQFSIADPGGVGRAFMALGTQLLADPTRLAEAQAQLWRDGLALWQSLVRRLQGQPAEPLIEPERGDRRFKDEAWTEELVYDYLKQSYLLSARWLRALVKDVPGLEPGDQQKVEF